ncbi:MAG: hypothetical protein ACE5Q6_08985 [Dehalococcoidia bacterium]
MTLMNMAWSTMEKLLHLAPEDPRELNRAPLLEIWPDSRRTDHYFGREVDIERSIAESTRQNINTLGSLSQVHQHIVDAAHQACQCHHTKPDCCNNKSMYTWCQDALKATAALAGIFQLYFYRYELYYKDWGCQQAWLHLLRLRYHSLAALYRCNPQDTDIVREFAWASREWENFCRDSDNHSLFLGANRPLDRTVLELGYIEAEVKRITRPDERSLNPFLTQERFGRTQFARLIHEWFLRDRSDWIGAVGLVVKAAFSRWRWRSGVVALLIFLATMFAIADGLGSGSRQVALRDGMIWIYATLGLLAVLGVAWRPLADVLLPRVWAATLVGYIPLLSSKELWLMIYSQDLAVSFIAMIQAAVFLISLLYLIWEIQRYLGRSPWRLPPSPRWKTFLMQPENWAVTKRAVVLFLISVFITSCSGLIMMDLAGGHLAPVYLRELDQSQWAQPVPIEATAGRLYWEVLVVYGPFAIFISIIAQLFWQEKPVTQSE